MVGMEDDYRVGLLALREKLDRLIADVEDLIRSDCDDDALQVATVALGELREAREAIEGKLRAE
jgi:hypothetical protein